MEATKVKWETMKLDNIIKADWNYKEDDDSQKAVLIANMNENGYVQNMVVRILPEGNYEVIDGNHRLEALKDMEVAEAMVCNLGEVSILKAQKLAIQLNETRFESNEYRLAQLIKNLANEYSIENLVETLPYSRGEIDSILHVADIDWDSLQTPTKDIEDIINFKAITLQVTEDVHAKWNEWREIAEDKAPAKSFEEAILLALITKQKDAT